MEFEEIRSIVTKAIEQTKTHQIEVLMRWLDGILVKYRESGLGSNSAMMKMNSGQRFSCPCGRSFSADITIRETTHVDASSPPATPMILVKHDLKHPHHATESVVCKRPRMHLVEPSTSTLNVNSTAANLIDRLTSSSSSSLMASWSTNTMKTYENSPAELLTVESNRGESDIELSSDESRCLDEMDAVLSPDKTAMSNFIYSHDLWTTTASLSGAASHSLANSTNNPDDDHHHHQQLINLKPIINEPLSPVTALVHDGDGGKTVATIHRRPMLVAFTDAEACSPTGPTHFKCTQCHETFDNLLLGQEHANTGLCTSETSVHALESSDSHPSPVSSTLFDPFQEELDEGIPARIDTKAACPICSKVFSSVHTMIRHKTSIHDRQVRYGCNICGRFFFRKDKLTSHMVYHQDFDTYVCCFCSLGCKSRMLMRQHLKRDHAITNDDTRWNEILSRCQVKKSLNLENNMSVAYGTDRSVIAAKRPLNSSSSEVDVKQSSTLSNN